MSEWICLNKYVHTSYVKICITLFYLHKYVLILHWEGIVVNLPQELCCHHFIRAILYETCHIKVSWWKTEKHTQKGLEEKWLFDNISIIFLNLTFKSLNGIVFLSDHTAFVSECLEAIPKVNGVKDICEKKTTKKHGALNKISWSWSSLGTLLCSIVAGN